MYMHYTDMLRVYIHRESIQDFCGWLDEFPLYKKKKDQGRIEEIAI